jgi:type II secretory pathway pseudopilin PulG
VFCAKCGTSIPDTAAQCPQCGASTAAPPRPNVPPPSPQATQPSPAWQNVPQAQRYYGPQQTDGKAVGSLILGILAIFPFGLLAGIPAVVLGHLSKSSIARSMGRLKGDGMATAGLIMGYASVALIPLILIIAAIAIPSLLRARMAANESGAVSTVRTVNTAQMTYASSYPDKGYAVDLATLGPGSEGSCTSPGYPSASHACLLDEVLAGPSCTAGSWCAKGGYRFNTTATCGSDGVCSGYVITATAAVPGSTGSQSFCSTADAVIRVHRSGPVLRPLTMEECQAWPAIQ